MKLLSRCFFTLLLLCGLSVGIAQAEDSYISAYEASRDEPTSCPTDPSTSYYRNCPDLYGYYYLKNPPSQYVYPWYYLGYSNMR